MSRLVLAATAVLNGKSSVLIGNSVVNPVAVLATRVGNDVRDGVILRASEPEREGVAELVPSTVSRLVLAATAVLNGKSSVLIGNSVVNPVAVLATRVGNDVRDGVILRASEPEREGVAELVPSTLSRLVLAATAVLNGKSSVLIGNSVVNPVAVLATRV